MRNPLLDQEFLRKLDLTKNKATYAKIILLTWDEEPVEEIQGKITAGSVNIDGASAIRRTCSLTMVSKNVDINNTYWALKNKFKLEVGVENTIDPSYPDIIWFKQGLFVFTSLNMNVQSNNFTISINGKDKGCLLNGEVGGTINTSTDFGKLEEYTTLDNGEIVRNIIDIPIVDIVRNAVHVYAGEPLHNIVINDIDEYGLELLEYRGDNNLYMPRSITSGEVSNMHVNKNTFYWTKISEQIEGQEKPVEKIISIYVDNDMNKKYDKPLIKYYDRTQNNDNVTIVYADKECAGEAYNIIKVEFGETAGYRRTDLTYPGELVANVGESLVSILDKIKNMFADFEYFYDIDGRFIFQKKKTYVNTSFNNLTTSDNDIYAADAAYTSSTTYSFEEGVLLSAFTNAPQILNIKNDYSIWGKRNDTDGAEIPIHMRYAIDFKPTYYRPIRFEYNKVSLTEDTYVPNKYYTYSNVLDKYILSTSIKFDNTKRYYEETDRQILTAAPFTDADYDWREIIYQMALDYFKYNYKKDNFTQLVANANPNHYPTGMTGYETYYTDMQGFWRQLYHPGVLGNEDSKYYGLFTEAELRKAAREVLIQERQLIEKKDIYKLIIEYIYDNFDDIKNNLSNYIVVDQGKYKIEDSYLSFLFTARQKKIYNFDYDSQEISNEQLIRMIYQAMTIEEINDGSSFITEINILLDQWFDMDAYDFSDELIDYVVDNYSDRKTFFSIDTDKNKIIVNNEHIQYILDMRQRKIDEIGGENYQVENSILVMLMIELFREFNDYEAQDFKIEIEEQMSLIYSPLNKDEYDLSNEILEEVYFSYNIDESGNNNLFLESNKGIGVKDEYLGYLLVLREEKIKEKAELNFYPQNNIFMTIVAQVCNNIFSEKEKTSGALSNLITEQKFYSRIENELEKYQETETNEDYDFSDAIIEYIEENYNRKDSFFASSNNNIYVQDKYLLYLFNKRQEKINRLGGGFKYLSNEKLIEIIMKLLNNTSINKNNFVSKMNEEMSKQG